MSEQHNLGVSAEAVRQETRELRVAKGHVRALLQERGDDVSQRGEALVDVLRLLQSVAGGFRARDALGTGEVDEVQPAGDDPPRAVHALGKHRHDAVRTTRPFVQRGSGGGATRGALRHDLEDVLGVSRLDARHRRRVVLLCRGGSPAIPRPLAIPFPVPVPRVALARESSPAAAPLPRRLLLRRVQQVAHLFVVNLAHLHADGERRSVRRAARLGRLEEFGERSSVDPDDGVALRADVGASPHGERLSRARLAVREDAHVVPVEDTRDERRELLVHLRLGGIWSEDAIEGVSLLLDAPAGGSSLARVG